MSDDTSSWRRRHVLTALSGTAALGTVPSSASAASRDDPDPVVSQDSFSVNFDTTIPSMDRQKAFAQSSLTPDNSPPDDNLTLIDSYEGETSTSVGCAGRSSGTTESDHYCILWMVDDGSGDPPTDGNGHYRYIVELRSISKRTEDTGFGCSGPYINEIYNEFDHHAEDAWLVDELVVQNATPKTIHPHNVSPLTQSISGEYGGVGFGFDFTNSWVEGYAGGDVAPGEDGEYYVSFDNDDGDPETQSVLGYAEISTTANLSSLTGTGLHWTAEVESLAYQDCPIVC